MKRILLSIFIFLLISIVACQQAAKTVTTTTAPATHTTGDAAVDAVGKDMNSTDSVEKDLSTDDLGNLDSGLSDVQNI